MKMMKKVFLGILLSVFIVLGLLPGMSMTAYADAEPIYKVEALDVAYNDTRTLAIDVTLPYNTTGKAIRSLLNYGDLPINQIQIQKGTNITVSGSDITVNGEGTSRIRTIVQMDDNKQGYCDFDIIVTKEKISWDYLDRWHVLFKDYYGSASLQQYSGYKAIAYPTGQMNAGFQFAVLYEGASAPYAFIDYNKHNLYGTKPYKTEDVAGTNAHIAYFDSATILAEYNEYLTEKSESFNPSQLTMQAKAEGTTVIYGIFAIPPTDWVKLYYSKAGEQVTGYGAMNIAYNAQYMNPNYDLAVIYSTSERTPTAWLDWSCSSSEGTANDRVEGNIAYYSGKTLLEEYTGQGTPSNLV